MIEMQKMLGADLGSREIVTFVVISWSSTDAVKSSTSKLNICQMVYSGVS